MLVLKDLGFHITYEYSLENKKTARCPEQYIGHDENGNQYLVVYAGTQIQSFYAQRAVEKQKELSVLFPPGMKCNYPVYSKRERDGFYAVYRYYKDYSEVRDHLPDKWIRQVYQFCGRTCRVTPAGIQRIRKDLLSAWPEEFHPEICRLENYRKFFDLLMSYESVTVCFQHGDYTTNNILRCGNDSLYLMDFEFAMSFQPVGFDLFDYHFATDGIYEDIPYLEMNRTKERLINEINQLVDHSYKAVACVQTGKAILKKTWADEMIYNRPDIFEADKAHMLNITYGNDSYNVWYTLSGYRAALHIWLRELPAAVTDEAVTYILKHHKRVMKINIDYAQTNTCHALEPDNNWVILLPETPEEIFERLGRKSKYNFRRERRLLEEQAGGLKYLVYNEKIPCELVNTYFKWKKISHGTEYSMTEEEYLSRYHVNGGMALSAGDRVAAILFYCTNEKTVYLENISYDMEFSKYSPGIILYEYFLEVMTKKGYKYVFLGNGNQPYKTRFGSTEYLVYSGVIYRNKLLRLINKVKNKKSIGDG